MEALCSISRRRHVVEVLGAKTTAVDVSWMYEWSVLLSKQQIMDANIR